MQDLLVKIIEMDEKARKLNEQAERQMMESEKEIEANTQKIYDDYIERAKERVEKNIAVDKEHAGQRWQEFSESVEKTKSELRRRFEENRDAWVEHIVSGVIG